MVQKLEASPPSPPTSAAFHHAHQPPHTPGAGHRRTVQADEDARHHHDRRDPGTAALGRAGRAAAPDVLPGAGRTAAFRYPDGGIDHGRTAGALRRGRGARNRVHRARAANSTTGWSPSPTPGCAAAPAGNDRAEVAAEVWAEDLPAHRAGAGPAGTGVLHLPPVAGPPWPAHPAGALLADLVDAGWRSPEPIVYEDFLPRSAAGIFQSNLTERRPKDDDHGRHRLRHRPAVRAPSARGRWTRSTSTSEQQDAPSRPPPRRARHRHSADRSARRPNHLRRP